MTLVCLALLAAPAPFQEWLEAPRIVVPDTTAEIRAAEDFDGDGDVDLLVYDRTGSTHTVALLLAEGGGYLEGPTTTYTNPSGGSVGNNLFAVADLTGDDLPDLVVDVSHSDLAQYGIRLYPNVGGAFGAPLFVPTGKRFINGIVADREGDGTPELALITLEGPLKLSWWTWDGATLSPGPSKALAVGTFQLVAGDISGDGLQDLILSEAYSAAIYASITAPTGDAGAPVQLPSLGELPSLGTSSGPKCHPADLDGDDDLDLFVAWTLGPTVFEPRLRVVIMENVGGVPVPGPELRFDVDPGDNCTGQGHLVDWDLDGDLDFVTASTTMAKLENRDGRFALADVLTVGQAMIGGAPAPLHYGGAVADLDGDHFPDFACGRVVHRGDGTFGGGRRTVGRPTYRAALDLDGDGDLDFLYADGPFRMNDGTGRFRDEAPRLPSPGPGAFWRSAMPWGDFDGDGWLDFLAARIIEEPYPPHFDATHLLRGSAGGAFTDAGVVASVLLPEPNEVPQCDLDGDGDIDLLGANGYWENGGAGTFSVFRSRWTGLARAAADVDGDDDVDLLTWAFAGVASSLSLQRNQGDGTFAAELLVSESASLANLGLRSYLVDLNGDGAPEAVTGFYAPAPSIEVFENLGASFAPALSVPGVDHAQDVLAFDDVDGDGLVDLLGAPRTSYERINGTWAVWRADGALSYEAPRTYIGPSTADAADVDGDGDVDWIGDDVVRGWRFHGAADGGGRQLGRGSYGPGVIEPLLGVVGPVRPGSSSAALRIVRARGGAVATIRMGAGPGRPAASVLGGVTRLLQPPFATLAVLPLGGPSGAAGEGAGELALAPFTGPLAGQTFWLQAVVTDPAAPGGLRSTNALELVFGF